MSYLQSKCNCHSLSIVVIGRTLTLFAAIWLASKIKIQKILVNIMIKMPYDVNDLLNIIDFIGLAIFGVFDGHGPRGEQVSVFRIQISGLNYILQTQFSSQF